MSDTPKKQELERQIDENLKRVYSDVVNKALPKKYLDTLAELKGQKPGDDDD